MNRHSHSLLRLRTVRWATLGRFQLPAIKNEPFQHYAPGSPERAALRNAIDRLKGECPDIPCIVGGREVRTGLTSKQVMPTNHSHVLCTYHDADSETLLQAADAALEAKKTWEDFPFVDRAAIFLKAADLLATKYRAEMCAAVMLGQGKNVWQAEIDAAVETIDFWRFNCLFADLIYSTQPLEHSFGVWNRMEYRPLEGFVAAITPFNFLAIGANLHSTPNLMGNVSLWKPSHTTILASYLVMKILKEAGMPDGVLNFVPADHTQYAEHILPHRRLAGVHFTGSTNSFASVWQSVSDNLRPYHSYPRVVGETGGKNFHFIHESADLKSTVMHTVRGAFEYQGQKCSACSRVYVPDTLWPTFRQQLLDALQGFKMGPCEDFSVHMCAVIDARAYHRIVEYVQLAHEDPSCTVIHGGGYSDAEGYFIEPTVVVTTDPHHKLMQEEIFGPVLTIYVYPAEDVDSAVALADSTSAYGLTGSIFAQDRDVVIKIANRLRYAAGNLYINDKCTGSIVAQQPFGGGRGSGTNDKSGSMLNLMRWVTCRTVKENFLPLDSFEYPSNSSDV
eukprot:TRINITY_DN12511_c0_g1_i1.p1 TRINITY_DN12511_c0_g1~~TRINITY_DN12511_c0_g1_i1.p1  ORF type:complete len:562 (+),score=91.98 TRINITY_DN12511_c0_g1_i1:42-1727(+)